MLFNRVKGSLVTNTKGATSHWSQLLFSLELQEWEKEKEREKVEKRKRQYLFFRFFLLWLDFYLALGMKLYLVVWVAMVTSYWNLQPLPPLRWDAKQHPHIQIHIRILTREKRVENCYCVWMKEKSMWEKRNNCLESTLRLCVIRLGYISKVWRERHTHTYTHSTCDWPVHLRNVRFFLFFFSLPHSLLPLINN